MQYYDLSFIFGIFVHKVQSYLSYKDQMALACVPLNIHKSIALQTKLDEKRKQVHARAMIYIKHMMHETYIPRFDDHEVHNIRVHKCNHHCERKCDYLTTHYLTDGNYHEFGSYANINGILHSLHREDAFIPYAIERQQGRSMQKTRRIITIITNP